MGNKGAFIVLNGKEMKPNFEVYEGKYKFPILIKLVNHKSIFSRSSPTRQTNDVCKLITQFNNVVKRI